MENKEKNTVNENIEENVKSNESIFGKLVVPVSIIVIMAIFAGVIFYAKAIKPKKDIDKEIGYKTEDYIVLGKTTGFEYEISQQAFDESVREETDSYAEVERGSKKGDQVGVNCTAYIDNKKVDELSIPEMELNIGEYTEGIHKTISDAVIGLKPGKKTEVTVDGKALSKVVSAASSYEGKKILLKIKVSSVSVLERDKITDKWVKENYNEDYGLETVEDFYNWVKEYLEGEAKTALWQKVLDKATMSSYPQEVYDSVVTEFTQDANYQADMFGMDVESYLKDFCAYTDESLEEEYLNEVKSELVMWALVKQQKFETTKAEIEEKYEELYLDCGYETVDEMKKEYSKKEIREAVLLDKVQNYVYENSKIKESFKIPKK